MLIFDSEKILRLSCKHIIHPSNVKSPLKQKTVAAFAMPAAHKSGRPKLGDYRLQCMLPRIVVEELVRVELASGDYRSRVAANVLCEWANKQRVSRLAD